MWLPFRFWVCKLRIQIQINLQRMKHKFSMLVGHNTKYPEKHLNSSTFAFKYDGSVCLQERKSQLAVSDLGRFELKSPNILQFKCVSNKKQIQTWKQRLGPRLKELRYQNQPPIFPLLPCIKSKHFRPAMENKDGDENGVQSTKTAAVY